MRVSQEYLDKRKHQIAQVAMRMYCEYGPSVSIASICMQAGIAKGTIFRYFPSRDDMFREIFEGCRAHALSLAGANVTADMDEAQAIRQLIRDAFVWPMGWPLEFKFVVMYTDAAGFYSFEGDGDANVLFDPLGNTSYAGIVWRHLKGGIPQDLRLRMLSSQINTAARYFISRGEVSSEELEAAVDAIFTSTFTE